MQTHLDLFTGVGGFHLAAGWAGFETIGFSEIDSYCCMLLAQKWPHIKNYGDIRTADFDELRGRIDVLSAGVPCQPASLAGKRRGAGDDRWLWPATLDVVGHLEPAWCIFENPPGILTLDEFGGVLLRLESLGYQVRAFSVPANAVGAKHRRQRVFIVANAEDRRIRCGRAQRESRQPSCSSQGAGFVADTSCELFDRSGNPRQGRRDESADGGEAVADAECRELQRRRGSGELGSQTAGQQSQGDQRQRSGNTAGDSSQTLADADRAQRREAQPGFNEYHGPQSGRGEGSDPLAGICSETNRFEFRLTQPPLCGRADGIPNRSHRLKALGNAVVPQQAYPFFEAIAQAIRESF